GDILRMAMRQAPFRMQRLELKQVALGAVLVVADRVEDYTCLRRFLAGRTGRSRLLARLLYLVQLEMGHVGELEVAVIDSVLIVQREARKRLLLRVLDQRHGELGMAGAEVCHI